MLNNIRLLFVMLFLFSGSVGATDDTSCHKELTAIFAASNSPLREDFKGAEIGLYVDQDEHRIITAKLYLITDSQMDSKSEERWPGAMTVGWIKYYENEGVLHQMPPNEDELPIILTTDKNLIEKFNKCRNKKSSELGSIFMRVTSKGRSYFYREPNQYEKIKDLFLIKGDMVKVLDEAGEFRFVQYKQKNGNVVEGWFLSKDLTIITP